MVKAIMAIDTELVMKETGISKKDAIDLLDNNNNNIADALDAIDPISSDK
jgi:NACalpha-BTF3-like transcription factor